jgi:hypothetical protein
MEIGKFTKKNWKLVNLLKNRRIGKFTKNRKMVFNNIILFKII